LISCGRGIGILMTLTARFATLRRSFIPYWPYLREKRSTRSFSSVRRRRGTLLSSTTVTTHVKVWPSAQGIIFRRGTLLARSACTGMYRALLRARVPNGFGSHDRANTVSFFDETLGNWAHEKKKSHQRSSGFGLQVFGNVGTRRLEDP
jgi:hypothetical protein